MGLRPGWQSWTFARVFEESCSLGRLLLEVAQIGVATRELLQVLTGSVISLFLFRRRFLALLDPAFQSYRGRREGQVFVLSAEARETLLIVSVLLPMSVSNLRAQVNSRLFASDASNWGEAGVVSSLPSKIGEELLCTPCGRASGSNF